MPKFIQPVLLMQRRRFVAFSWKLRWSRRVATRSRTPWTWAVGCFSGPGGFSLSWLDSVWQLSKYWAVFFQKSWIFLFPWRRSSLERFHRGSRFLKVVFSVTLEHRCRINRHQNTAEVLHFSLEFRTKGTDSVLEQRSRFSQCQSLTLRSTCRFVNLEKVCDHVPFREFSSVHQVFSLFVFSGKKVLKYTFEMSQRCALRILKRWRWKG